jgi:hypothetical protein
VDGVSVTQVSRIPAGALYLAVDVTLTNTTGAPMTNVYYLRTVDADNCRMVSQPVCDSNGDGTGDQAGVWETHNEVVSQVRDGGAASVVSATQTDGSYIDLRSTAAGSVAAIAVPGSPSCSGAAGLQQFFTDPPAGNECPVTIVGATDFSDQFLFLVIRTASLAAGASTTFQFRYLLSAQAQAAQTVTFPAPGAPRADGTIVLSATASSGLPVTYMSQTPDICTVSGNIVTPVRAGTCTITAYQAGNDDFAAAQAVRSFAVGGVLAITGAPIVLTVIVGTLLLAAGCAARLLARRRRPRFQA